MNLGFVLCIADHCYICWNIQFRKKKINLFNQVLPFFPKDRFKGFSFGLLIDILAELNVFHEKYSFHVIFLVQKQCGE